jgi:mRNA interferase MazF
VICDRGAVVVVPFPFVDAPVTKRRPTVVITASRFNESNGHAVLAMITTAARSRWPSDLPIEHLDEAGLSRSCVVRWKVFTLPNELIARQIGSLAGEDRAAFDTALRTHFFG